MKIIRLEMPAQNTIYISIIFCLYSWISFAQLQFAGNYSGKATKDLFGEIQVDICLNNDSTYLIVMEFKFDHCDIYENRWIYQGKWFSQDDWIYFRPSPVNKCKEAGCKQLINNGFPFISIFDRYGEVNKTPNLLQKIGSSGYTNVLKVSEGDKVYFDVGHDCFELIWVNHAVERL